MKLCFFPLLILLFFSCAQKDLSESPYKKQTPVVVNVYPTTDTLPENLLRMYIQFSHSMKAVNNLEHIKLVNDKGEEIKGALFNNVYELWDSEQKVLTLIFDPSRVKTGLAANETLGRALASIKYFQLVIEKAEDIYGNLLATQYTKKIYVAKEDKEIPDIKNWKITAPKSNSINPLAIHFPQVLDRLSLFHRIRLLNENNEVVAGKIEVGNQERSWRFTPKHQWKKGLYTLQINSRLEDPAGNNLNGLFDHELGSLKSEQEGKLLEIKTEII